MLRGRHKFDRMQVWKVSSQDKEEMGTKAMPSIKNDLAGDFGCVESMTHVKFWIEITSQ